MKYYSLILFLFLSFSEFGYCQSNSSKDSIVKSVDPLFSGLHTLSIHIRDTTVHDSLFLFLTDKLNLPVYYYPLKMGARRYAGVYAGNLVLEPCGPYSNFSYASNNFRAIFFGLTFETYKSLEQSGIGLAERKINYEVDGNVFIYPRDTLISGENMTLSIMDKADKISDRKRLDSLRVLMTDERKNRLGIEYVKEIWIGYKDTLGLNKWKDLIKPSELINNEIWNESNIPEIHFIKSDIKEVRSVVFKVKSLEKAKKYLDANNLSGIIHDNKIEMDKARTFGLSIYLSE
jgi:hypothetical protein